MLDALRHFTTELGAAVAAAALIGAGLALLAAPQASIAERIPVLGAFVARIRTSAATVLIAAGVGVLGFVAGYVHRGGTDQSAHLRAELAQARADIDLLQQTAMAANARERTAADARDSDNEKVRRYAEDVAKKGNDLVLAGAELERLRDLVEHHKGAAAGAAAAVRANRRASLGCKVILSQYVAALNEANRRLENDAAFYDDVRRNFGAGTAR